MKKGTRLLKRFVALFMVLLLSIENFAAVVSDNDGSAFITKAEFDSLKNDFQSQIDQYNTSIGAKIDGAIASYLAGISVSKKEPKKFVLGKWNKVTMMNGALENVWQYPSINLSLSFNATTGNDKNMWTCAWWTTSKYVYTRPTNVHAKRLIVDAGDEQSTGPEYVVWNGRSKNLLDQITLSRAQGLINSSSAILWHIGLSDRAQFSASNITQIEPGYYPSLETETTSIWNPKIYWNAVYESVVEVKTANKFYNTSNIFSVALQRVNNELYDFEHILNYENYTFPQLTDIDWVKTIRTMENTSTKTRDGMLQTADKDGKWFAMVNQDGNIRKNRQSGTVAYSHFGECDFSGFYSGESIADNSNFVGVGIVNKTYDSKHIYQTSEVWSDIVRNKEFRTDKMNLVAGLPFVAGREGDKVVADLEFDNMYRDGVPQSTMDIDVFLAMVPFEEGSSVIDDAKRVKCDNQPSGQDYMITVNNKVRLSWTFGEDGIVYIKWRPHDTTGFWQVDLDFTKNPIYTYESSEQN